LSDPLQFFEDPSTFFAGLCIGTVHRWLQNQCARGPNSSPPSTIGDSPQTFPFSPFSLSTAFVSLGAMISNGLFVLIPFFSRIRFVKVPPFFPLTPIVIDSDPPVSSLCSCFLPLLPIGHERTFYHAPRFGPQQEPARKISLFTPTFFPRSLFLLSQNSCHSLGLPYLLFQLLLVFCVHLKVGTLCFTLLSCPRMFKFLLTSLRWLFRSRVSLHSNAHTIRSMDPTPFETVLVTVSFTHYSSHQPPFDRSLRPALELHPQPPPIPFFPHPNLFPLLRNNPPLSDRFSLVHTVPVERSTLTPVVHLLRRS